jgi:hypothetical protein
MQNVFSYPEYYRAISKRVQDGYNVSLKANSLLTLLGKLAAHS